MYYQEHGGKCPKVGKQQARHFRLGKVIAHREKGESVKRNPQDASRVCYLQQGCALGVVMMSLSENHIGRAVLEGDFHPEQPCAATIEGPMQFVQQDAGDTGQADAGKIEQPGVVTPTALLRMTQGRAKTEGD